MKFCKDTIEENIQKMNIEINGMARLVEIMDKNLTEKPTLMLKIAFEQIKESYESLLNTRKAMELELKKINMPVFEKPIKVMYFDDVSFQENYMSFFKRVYTHIREFESFPFLYDVHSHEENILNIQEKVFLFTDVEIKMEEAIYLYHRLKKQQSISGTLYQF